MRILLGAVLLCSPLVLVSAGTAPAFADSAIGELRSTEGLPADGTAATPAATPATADRGAADEAARPARRHRVAGSHYERERLRSSQIHG